MDDIIEPRTNADIIRDLLGHIEEWVRKYERCPRGCCGEWKTECPSCGAEEGDYDDPATYRTHEPTCQLAKLIREAEAFLAAEDEIRC